MFDLYSLLNDECRALLHDLEEAQEQLASFEKGYLSTAKIKGHEYVYLKRREGDKIISRYIGKRGSESVKAMEKERSEYEELLKMIHELEEEYELREKQMKLERPHHIYSFEEIQEIVRPLLLEHGVKSAYLFGSYARGEAKRDSDVDIIFDGGDLKGLLALSHLRGELKASLGKEVDLLLLDASLHPLVHDNIERDKRPLL